MKKLSNITRSTGSPSTRAFHRWAATSTNNPTIAKTWQASGQPGRSLVSGTARFQLLSTAWSSAFLRSRPSSLRTLTTSAALTKSGTMHRSDEEKQKASESPSVAAQQTVARAQEQSGSVEQTVYTLPHPIWQGEYVDAVKITHNPPKATVDKLAYYTVQLMRFNFDWMSGYSWGRLTEEKWLRRILFLETVAGVPGSVAATLRHLRSLRRMQRDHGWIHTLLEEAENERMHLLTGLNLKKPSRIFKAAVWLTQGVFFNFFFAAYLVSPRFCHRFVGYLEEEAVKTYTHLLHDIDAGKLPKWTNMPAPDIARQYWKLSDDAKWRDVVAVIRADESHHRDVNHTFAGLHLEQDNPFPPGH